jgi:hypothetical protein
MAMSMAPPKLRAAFTIPKFVNCFSLPMNCSHVGTQVNDKGEVWHSSKNT